MDINPLEKEADILNQQKTEEELVQFELEEDLPELIRIQRLLVTGHPVQKISALYGLEPALVVVGVSDLEANLSKIMPLLKMQLSDVSRIEAEHGYVDWTGDEGADTQQNRTSERDVGRVGWGG